VIGAGYTDAKRCPGWLVEGECKSDRYLCHKLRPQIIFMLSEYGSGYIGTGLAWELFLTKQIILIPSFSPVFYWKGKGKDLGCPLEFRSAIEISYEMNNHMRLGLQVFHISNASISNKNPGLNAVALCMAFPLFK
jgi:hypothetical protein